MAEMSLSDNISACFPWYKSKNYSARLTHGFLTGRLMLKENCIWSYIKRLISENGILQTVFSFSYENKLYGNVWIMGYQQ